MFFVWIDFNQCTSIGSDAIVSTRINILWTTGANGAWGVAENRDGEVVLIMYMVVSQRRSRLWNLPAKKFISTVTI